MNNFHTCCVKIIPVIDSYQKQFDIEFEKTAKVLFAQFDKDGNNYLEGKEVDIFIAEFTIIYVEKLLDFAKSNYAELFANVPPKRIDELRKKLAIPAKLKIKKCFEDFNADFKLDFDEIKQGLKFAVEAYWHDRLNDKFEEWLKKHLKNDSPNSPRPAK